MNGVPDWGLFARWVEKGARKMGRPTTTAEVEQFVVHARELLEWNRTFNLTGLHDVKALAERQFLDVIPLADVLPPGWRVLDVGSGGGFPGIPLKVLRPDLRLLLIDGIRKKTNFLKHVVRVLGLTDCSVRQVRAERLEGEGIPPGTWDAVVSKAVGTTERLVELCGKLIRPGGWLVVMTGKAEGGRAVASEGFSLREQPYRLPFEGTERRLVRVCKVGPFEPGGEGGE